MFQAGPDTIVSFFYELFDAEGELVEACSVPRSIVFGYGQAAPDLEAALSGLGPGQSRQVKLKANRAFGPRRQDKILRIERSEFPGDIEVGDEFAAETEAGEPGFVRVLEVAPDFVVIDTNHPLAGQIVELHVEVDEVRPATAAELDGARRMLHSSRDETGQSLLPASRLLRGGATKTARNSH